MKTIREKTEDAAAAAAFAEAGEDDMALELLRHDSCAARRKATEVAGLHRGRGTSAESAQKVEQVAKTATFAQTGGKRGGHVMKNIIQRIEDMASAVAFAEAGEDDMALELSRHESYPAEKKATETAGLKLEKGRSRKLAQKVDQLAEAATFAQAGEHEYARSLIQERERFLQKQGRGRILVVGREYSFSEQLMDYAANMAKRMGRDIVAVNVTQSDDAFRFLATYHQTVRDDFKVHAVKSAASFLAKAAEKGVGLEHVIRFSDPDEAIRSICDEIGDVTYVLTEPDPTESARSAASVDIPVFCVSPHAVA